MRHVLIQQISDDAAFVTKCGFTFNDYGALHTIRGVGIGTMNFPPCWTKAWFIFHNFRGEIPGEDDSVSSGLSVSRASSPTIGMCMRECMIRA